MSLGATRPSPAIAVLLSCLLPMAEVAAQQIYTPTITLDLSQDDGELSLREAMDLANGDMDSSVIMLAPVEYVLANCGVGGDDDENAQGDLDHTDTSEENDLTIVGDPSSSIIRQSCDDRGILGDQVETGTLRIEGVRLVGGGGLPSRPSLFSRRDTELIDALVLSSQGLGIIMAGSDQAGASRPSLVMTRTTVTNSVSVGVQITRVDATLTDVNIELNDIGVRAFLSTVLLMDSRVRINESNGVSAPSASLQVIGGEISDNGGAGIEPFLDAMLDNTIVQGNGGAGLSCSSCRQLFVAGSQILGNGVGGGEAGGIRMTGAIDGFEVTISETFVLENQTSGSGGGLLVDLDPDPGAPRGPVSISGSLFAENLTGVFGDGGAIATRAVPMTIASTYLANNRASNPTLSGGDGGAIHHEGAADPAIDDSLEIRDSFLYLNQADDGDGGAIRVIDADLSVVGSDITDNLAGGSGGGVSALRPRFVQIEDDVVANNSAEIAGGGVHVDGTANFSALEVTRSFVGFNRFGGISVSDTRIDLENATLYFNLGGPFTSASGLQSIGGQAVDVRFSSIVANQDSEPQVFVSPSGSFGLTASVVDGSVPACNAVSAASGGFNVVRDGSCPNGPADDLISLSGLNQADYVGSPRPVLVPNGASVLVGRVPVAACSVATDGRDVPRPQGTDCDTGAAERRDGGGISGPAPVLVWGLAEDAEEEIVDRLQGLADRTGIEFPIVSKGSGSSTDLVDALRRAALVFLSPGSEDDLLEDVLPTLTGSILSWDPMRYLGLGLTLREETTQQPARIDSSPVMLTHTPTPLAVCNPWPEGETLVSFTAKRKGALCRYDGGVRLADGSRAPGRRIALAFDPGLATMAGWELFDRAVIEAISEGRP